MLRGLECHSIDSNLEDTITFLLRWKIKWHFSKECEEVFVVVYKRDGGSKGRCMSPESRQDTFFDEMTIYNVFRSLIEYVV